MAHQRTGGATRIASLDSLRGLAALSVVGHHCVLISDGVAKSILHGAPASGTAHFVESFPARLLFDGSGAVLIFFVLSGLVLSLSETGHKRTTYAAFMVKRVMRIWPAFAMAVLGAALLKMTLPLRPISHASSLLNGTWTQPLTPEILLDHLLMVGRHTWLDEPMWSLVQEIRISFILPIILLPLMRRAPGLALAGAGLLTLASGVLAGHLHPGPLLASLFSSAALLLPFGLGIALTLNVDRVRSRLSALPAWGSASLWLLGLLLVAYPPLYAGGLRSGRDGLLEVSACLGATVIVGLCTVEGRAFRFLTGRVPAYFGRISYSLYLWHWVVLVTVTRLTSHYIPLYVAVFCGAMISVAVADLSERAVERPAQQIGRRIAKVLNGRRRAAGWPVERTT